MSESILFDEIGLNGQPYMAGAWKHHPSIIHDENNICGFFGDYRWLSNTWPVIVKFEGKEYPSPENAFHAAKFKPAERLFFETCSFRDAIKYKRKNPSTLYSSAEWDDLRLGVMSDLLRQKFSDKNVELLNNLRETGSKYLEETNWWNDCFWGKNLDGVGENNLGKLLMRIRRDRLETETCHS